VGPRAGLDTETTGKILSPPSNLDRPVVQPVGRHYADSAAWLTRSDIRSEIAVILKM
jgi:hypothetical protein